MLIAWAKLKSWIAGPFVIYCSSSWRRGRRIFAAHRRHLLLLHEIAFSYGLSCLIFSGKVWCFENFGNAVVCLGWGTIAGDSGMDGLTSSIG